MAPFVTFDLSRRVPNLRAITGPCRRTRGRPRRPTLQAGGYVSRWTAWRRARCRVTGHNTAAGAATPTPPSPRLRGVTRVRAARPTGHGAGTERVSPGRSGGGRRGSQSPRRVRRIPGPSQVSAAVSAAGVRGAHQLWMTGRAGAVGGCRWYPRSPMTPRDGRRPQVVCG